ncbi:MAG TPA: alpha/beta hydrolase [Terriglobales bacterium]|nr:alpha/beta hydrolase [Terriglobales bacterium]
MFDSTRREFTKKSLLLALTPMAAETPGLYASASATPAAAENAPNEFFPELKREQIKTSGATINVVHGGHGSPLLLLHGIPETHVMWRKVAPALARNFTLVIADLRGYGDSSKPPGGADHFGYSKRAMAQDQVEVMEHLGFRKFALVGHDRGGRVAHRLALDYPDRLSKLVIVDIVPTYRCYADVNKDFATVFFHWFMLVQPSPFPETMLGNSAELFLNYMLFRLGGEEPRTGIPEWVDQAAYNDYLRCFRDAAAIRALCEDYRAAASIDLVHDKADLDKKIQCPLLVLWSEKGPFHRMYDVLQTWRERATNATGKALPAGHFLPEQLPERFMNEIEPFLSA